MSPDFLIGCHGNQDAANQDILNHNSKSKTDIEKNSSWFCRYYLACYSCQISLNSDIALLGYECAHFPTFAFS